MVPFRRIVSAALTFGLATYGTQAGANTPDRLLPSALTIHIKDFRFSPTPATIRAGDRVTFVNDDDEAHTATGVDRTFDSEGLDTAQTWQHVFAKPGVYKYFCELHPYMTATIVVERSAT